MPVTGIGSSSIADCAMSLSTSAVPLQQPDSAATRLRTAGVAPVNDAFVAVVCSDWGLPLRRGPAELGRYRAEARQAAPDTRGTITIKTPAKGSRHVAAPGRRDRPMRGHPDSPVVTCPACPAHSARLT